MNRGFQVLHLLENVIKLTVDLLNTLLGPVIVAVSTRGSCLLPYGKTFLHRNLSDKISDAVFESWAYFSKNACLLHVVHLAARTLEVVDSQAFRYCSKGRLWLGCLLEVGQRKFSGVRRFVGEAWRQDVAFRSYILL